MATSYNGWTASPDSSSINIVRLNPLGITPFSNGGFAGGVKGGDVQTIFLDLVTELNQIEPILRDPNTGQLGYGCWGYEYRANVNNPSQLSCHASGTAIDYNAPLHRNGTSLASGNSGWSIGNISRVKDLLPKYGGTVRWLTGNDPMHFEIFGTSALAASVAARLRNNPPTGSTTDDEDWLMAVTEAQWNALVNQVRTIADQVNNMYSNEALEGYPYNKTAANFNDTRSVDEHVAAVAAQVAGVQGALDKLPSTLAVDVLHERVKDIQERIYTPGASYDNIQRLNQNVSTIATQVGVPSDKIAD